jgi:hypothetical protein
MLVCSSLLNALGKLRLRAGEELECPVSQGLGQEMNSSISQSKALPMSSPASPQNKLRAQCRVSEGGGGPMSLPCRGGGFCSLLPTGGSHFSQASRMGELHLLEGADQRAGEHRTGCGSSGHEDD